MKALRCMALLFAAGLVFLGGLASCASGSSTKPNLASDRMGSLAGLPPESSTPSGGVVPNPAPFLDAGRLAAANTEAGNVKLAARAYLTEHPDQAFGSKVTSDDLLPGYLRGPLRARYYTSPTTLRITGVDAAADGWQDIVFSLSQQKWVAGAPDNDRPGDQDMP